MKFISDDGEDGNDLYDMTTMPSDLVKPIQIFQFFLLVEWEK